MKTNILFTDLVKNAIEKVESFQGTKKDLKIKLQMRLSCCGNCEHFKPHKSKSGYANGYWLDDGKCKFAIVTVVGDACNHFLERQLT